MTDTPDSGIEIKPSADGKVNIIMDMSQYDLFTTCAYRYNCRHNLLKAPIHKSESLDKGGVAHEGLEVYYSMLRDGKPFKERIEATEMKIRAASSDPEISDLEPEDVELLISGIKSSLDYWQWQDEMMKILEVEQPFLYLLYEDEFVRILISGKIDLLVDIPPFQNSPAYFNHPVDHKTYLRDFPVRELNNQFINYASAVGSQYLTVNRIGLQKSLPAHEKFFRPILSWEPAQFAAWKDNLAWVILHFYLECVRTNYWPTDFTSCDKYNRICEYFNVCKASSESDKKRLLEDTFMHASPWDVTARLNKK